MINVNKLQILVPLGLLLGVMACQSPPPSSGSDGAPLPPAEAPDPQAESGADPAAALGVSLVLAGDGLRFVVPQSSSTSFIPFDSDAPTAIKATSTALGEPTQTVNNEECPAGPMAITLWPNGFAVNASEGEFVGWSAQSQEGTPPLTTAAGVGIGSTRRDLEQAYTVEVFESSLGTEFTTGEMSGLLSSDQPDGVITNLWAGIACNFR